MGAFGMPGTFGAGGKFTLTPRANGGPVMSNKPYLVGERGPELFVPGGSGNIVPNGQMGGTAVTYNINAVDSQSFQMALAKDPSFVFAVTEAGRRKQPGRI
jgi:phage-related minor tail protein